jgi:hypothetical protein
LGRGEQALSGFDLDGVPDHIEKAAVAGCSPDLVGYSLPGGKIIRVEATYIDDRKRLEV